MHFQAGQLKDTLQVTLLMWSSAQEQRYNHH